MARERILKPRFFSSEDISRLEYAARLLFQCMWCYADKNGNFRYNHKLLKAWAFPFDDDITSARVQEMVERMVSLGMVALYEVDGVSYCNITRFVVHQKPHPKEPAVHPEPAVVEPEQNTAEPEQKTAQPEQAVFLPEQDKYETSTSNALPSLSSSPALSTSTTLRKEAEPPTASAASVACPKKEVFDAWNQLAKESEGTIEGVLKLTSSRRAAIGARLSEPLFRDNWRQSLQRIKASAFCNGIGGNGWRANLDWFVRPDTMAKILEGRYDNRETTQAAKPKPKDPYEEMLAQERQRLGRVAA